MRVPRRPMVALAVALLASSILATEEFDARAPVIAAKARSLKIPLQAEALVQLAWRDESVDSRVRAEARQELVFFGHYALRALRKAVKEVDPTLRADATATLIEARMRDPGGNPADFLPGLEEALWFGSIEAKRIAMHELARYPFPPAVLTTIDAIYEHPELTLDGLRALGAMQNARGRFFLRRVLQFGDPHFKPAAAIALGRVGETGLLTLREQARSEDRAVREAAIDALLPYANPDDLTTLYEYIGFRTEDDPEVRARVLEKAAEIEQILEELQLAEAASGETEPEEDPDAEN